MSAENNITFKLQFLEKIGVPLTVAARGRPGTPGEEDRQSATHLATLLGKTIEAGLGLGNKFDLQNAGPQADSIRLALAALSAPLVAHEYGKGGKKPEEIDTLRLTKALESILAFADNFTPAVDNSTRLEQLSPGMSAPFDENQAVFQYIAALTPALNAVSAFSFGQPEDKLMPDIATRLEKQAAALRQDIAPTLTDAAAQRQAELKILAALSSMYAATHHAELQRLSALDDAARAQENAAPADGDNASLSRIWAQFDKQVSMMTLLAQSATSDSRAAPPSPPLPSPPPPVAAPPTPPAAPAAPAEPPAAPVVPAQTGAPAAAPEAPLAPPPVPQDAPQEEVPANPMSFFKPGAKPRAQEGDDDNNGQEGS